MKNLLDTEGTVLFPFQTEIHFIWTIFSTVKRLVIGTRDHRHCCKVSDEAAFCLIQRPYISKTLLTRRISPRGSP